MKKLLLLAGSIISFDAAQAQSRFMKKIVSSLFVVTLISMNSNAQNGPKIRRIEGKGNDGLVLDFVNGMHDSILASPAQKYDYPLYDNNKGPVYVDVYNSAIAPAGDYAIVFDDTTTHSTTNDLIAPTSGWHIVHLPSGTTVYSDTTIEADSTQDIPAWGMKIRTRPIDDPGTSIYTGNGFLEATMTFANPSTPWLKGLADQEGPTNTNWIRSGTSEYLWPYNVFDDVSGTATDSFQVYENCLNRTWAPYRFCAYTSASSNVCQGGPAWGANFVALSKLQNLASVDIVFTNDQSKWTRCPVIEEQEDSALAIGGAHKLDMRLSSSVDKNGLANYPSADNNDFPTGMGWFPGYAINVETGERLNIAFGEDSWLVPENGADMKWNPTSTVDSVNGIFGSKHYIYVFGHNGNATYPSTDLYLPNGLRDIPLYDAGTAMHNLFTASTSSAGLPMSVGYKREIYADAMWVNIPLLETGYNLLQTDANVRLRVSKKYRQYATNNANSNNPMYAFSTGTLLGISNLSDNNLVSIYPNPASQNININYCFTPDYFDLKIYDASGRLVKRMDGITGGQTNISIDELKNGFYLINLSNEKTSVTKRFVKQ